MRLSIKLEVSLNVTRIFSTDNSPTNIFVKKYIHFFLIVSFTDDYFILLVRFAVTHKNRNKTFHTRFKMCNTTNIKLKTSRGRRKGISENHLNGYPFPIRSDSIGVRTASRIPYLINRKCVSRSEYLKLIYGTASWKTYKSFQYTYLSTPNVIFFF